jgi:hypothetical protein
MKLELKHLAPYLPYKLRVLYHFENRMMNAGNGSSKNWIGITALLQRQSELCHPILRPLSDLTKEIEVGGKKFIPIKEINWTITEYPLMEEDGTVFLQDSCELNMLEISEVYKVYQMLFEWHFDVFGLIEQGLAIDVNTLKIEP